MKITRIRATTHIYVFSSTYTCSFLHVYATDRERIRDIMNVYAEKEYAYVVKQYVYVGENTYTFIVKHVSR